MVLYLTENLLSGTDVAITSSSEDALYVLENLHNGRPSKPFRFTGKGAAGNPEWICAEFDAPKLVTFIAVFNHNLTALAGGNDSLVLKACDLGCAICPWATPGFQHSLKDRLITGWNDLFHIFNQTRLAFRLEVIDESNPADVEIGELYLGEYTALPDARVKPGRSESPTLYRQKHKTHYGQHWTESLSHNVALDLVITSLNNPSQVDAVRTMILAIHGAGGHFVIVPDDSKPFCYYVSLENEGNFMAEVARGLDSEVSEWTFRLESLTKGITLL